MRGLDLRQGIEYESNISLSALSLHEVGEIFPAGVRLVI